MSTLMVKHYHEMIWAILHCVTGDITLNYVMLHAHYNSCHVYVTCLYGNDHMHVMLMLNECLCIAINLTSMSYTC